MRSDIVPGAVFPDYELSDHTGKRRRLSELQGQDPMILVLSRGGYCPKDRRQHEGLVQLHRELEVGYCRLVTISTDNITETSQLLHLSARMRCRWSLRFQLSYLTLLFRRTNRSGPVDFLLKQAVVVYFLKTRRQSF